MLEEGKKARNASGNKIQYMEVIYEELSKKNSSISI